MAGRQRSEGGLAHADNEAEVDASTCGLVSVMTCFTAHQSSALDNEAEGDASTFGLVKVMPCLASTQPSALDNEVREREIHRERESE